MNHRPLHMGVIGLNNQGKDHIEAIQAREDVILAAVCDADASFEDAYDVPFFSEPEALFASGLVDAAVVAVPHHVHLAIVQQAAAAGIHLLKEKPIARTLSEAHAIARAAAGRIVLQTGVQRRHHATYAHLKTALKGADIHSAWLEMTVVPHGGSDKGWRSDLARAGGGVFIDLGYHAVDLLHYLLGPMDPVSCSTFLNTHPSSARQTEDEARVWARAGNAWVRIVTGRADEKRETLWIDTSTARYEASRERVIRHAEGRKELLERSERAWTYTLQRQLDTFLAAIASEERYRNDPPEQMPTIRFIEQCYGLLRARGIQEDAYG